MKTVEEITDYMKVMGVKTVDIPSHIYVMFKDHPVYLKQLNEGDIIYRYEVIGENAKLLEVARRNGINIPHYYFPIKNTAIEKLGLY